MSKTKDGQTRGKYTLQFKLQAVLLDQRLKVVTLSTDEGSPCVH